MKYSITNEKIISKFIILGLIYTINKQLQMAHKFSELLAQMDTKIAILYFLRPLLISLFFLQSYF